MNSLQKKLTSKKYNKFRTIFDNFDMMCLNFLRTRSTIIAALLGISLIILALYSSDWILIIQVLISAAMGYVFGFVPGVAFDLFVTLMRLNSVHFEVDADPFPVLQFFICAYITWLGFRHHQFSKLLKEKLGEFEHPDHVVPWTFINEVRNSLMAMRLLLFRYTKETTKQADLKVVEEELLRLESLFGALPEEAKEKKSS